MMLRPPRLHTSKHYVDPRINRRENTVSRTSIRGSTKHSVLASSKLSLLPQPQQLWPVNASTEETAHAALLAVNK